MADPIDGAGYGDIGFFDGGYGDHILGYGHPLTILSSFSVGGNRFHDIGGEICTIRSVAGTFDSAGFEVFVGGTGGSGGVKAYSGVRGQGFWVYPSEDGSELSFVMPDLYEQLGATDVDIVGPGGTQNFPSILYLVRYSHKTNNELIKSRWPGGGKPYYIPRAVPRGGARWTPGVIEKLCESLGEDDALLGGMLYTYLTAPLAPSDVTLNIESVHDWETFGDVRIGQEKMRYESVTDTTIGVVERHPNAQPYPVGTPVINISRRYSQVDQVRNTLFYPTAEDEYLDVLLRNHGLPVPLLEEDQRRAFGIFASYPPAGPLRTVADMLTTVRPGQMRYGDVEPVSAHTIRLDGTGGGFPGGQFGWQGRLIRILEPSANAGLYRIQYILGDNVTAKIHRAAGPYWSGSRNPPPGLSQETGVAFELVIWDVWEDPTEQAKFHVDLLEISAAASAKGATYLQGGEPATSTTSTSVTVLHDINQVLGVFLRGDVERDGTNYFTGGSSLGKVITLGTALPSANEDVFVDYGAEKTAQLLVGPHVDGETYYPFYLSGPSGVYEDILYVVRAAGYIPVVTTVVI
jgi:hypothetical protein